MYIFFLSVFLNFFPLLVVKWHAASIAVYVFLIYMCSKYFYILVNFYIFNSRANYDTDNKDPLNSKYKHFITYVYSNESLEILESSIKAVAEHVSSKENTFLILAHEERYKSGLDIAKHIKENYSQYFANIISTEHKLSKGEVACKSTNMNYSMRVLSDYLRELNISKEDAFITFCDSDSYLSAKYLKDAEAEFTTNNNRRFTVWSAPMVFTYNYSSSLPALRVINGIFSLSNIALGSLKNKNVLINSTYTLSYALLEDLGGFSKNVINDDLDIYLNGYIKYPDKFESKSLITYTVSRIPNSKNNVLRNQYTQVKRWASGVDDIYKRRRSFLKSFTRKKLDFRSRFMLFKNIANRFIDIELLAVSGPLISTIFLLVVFMNRALSLGLDITIGKTAFVFLSFLPLLLTILTWFAVKKLLTNPVVRANREPPKKLSKLDQFIELFMWWMYPLLTIVFITIPSLHSQIEMIKKKEASFKITDKT